MERSQSCSSFNTSFFTNENNDNNNNNSSSKNFNNNNNSNNNNNKNHLSLKMFPRKAINFRQTHLQQQQLQQRQLQQHLEKRQQQQLQHSGSSDNITKLSQTAKAHILQRFQQHPQQLLQQSQLMRHHNYHQHKYQHPHQQLQHYQQQFFTSYQHLSTELSDDMDYAADHEDEEEEDDDINDRTLTPMDNVNDLYKLTQPNINNPNLLTTSAVTATANMPINANATHVHHVNAKKLPFRKQLRFQEHKQQSESSLLLNRQQQQQLELEQQHLQQQYQQRHPPPLTRNCSTTTTASTSSASSTHCLKHGDSIDSSNADLSPLSRRHPFGILKRDNSIHSDSSRYSSVDSLLEARKPDPEAILINLGFGPIGTDDILSRIPKRFLKPSQVRGCDTAAFVKRLQLANNLADHSVLGYRGLTGNPDVPPSSIVAKIMKRFEVNQRKKSMDSMEHMIH